MHIIKTQTKRRSMSNQKTLYSFTCKSNSFGYVSPACFSSADAARKAGNKHAKMYAEKMKVTTKQHKQ